MKELVLGRGDLDGLAKEILDLVQRNINIKTIYVDGWNGFGTAAILRSIVQVLQSMEAPPPELCFGRILCCSMWKSKRVMQKEIAMELKLDHKTMALFEKQDEEDDFNGFDPCSRDVLRDVAAVIDQTLRASRFMIILFNGSDGEIILSQFGIPNYLDCLIIWTFKRTFLNLRGSSGGESDNKIITDKLRYTDLFLFGHWKFFEEVSSQNRITIFWEEAASIVMPDVDPIEVTYCCLYGLFLQLQGLQNISEFSWAAHASNFWICDGFIQGARAWEICNALHPKINFECDATLLDKIYKRLKEEPEVPFMVVDEDDDDFYQEDLGNPFLMARECDGDLEEMPYYCWISVTSQNENVQESMQTLLARASSIFLKSKRIYSTTGIKGATRLPNGLFEQGSNVGVLILSYSAFSFALPPFVHCRELRFLGLDHCTDDHATEPGEGCSTKWTWLHSLWVLDLHFTDWSEILSKIYLSTNLKELNIEGVGCWQHANELQNRLSHLQRLRIIKPVHQPVASADINNFFMDKKELQVLDLSGNCDMKNLPASLSEASSLQVLVLDGCAGLENVVLSNSTLTSFRFDGYGPASHWTSPVELPPPKNPNQEHRPHDADVNTSKISLGGCTHRKILLLRGLPNLVELDLSGCAIKVLDLGSMVVDVPRLKRLFLLNCEYLCAIIWSSNSLPSDWQKIIPKLPLELEVLCIDSRPSERAQGCTRPTLALDKPFGLQVHAITADARLARSLWAPIHYHEQCFGSGVHFKISITSSSSTLCGGFIHPKVATGKESNNQQHHNVVASTGPYGDVYVFANVDHAQTPMQAFPQPPPAQLDRHIEIGDGSYNVESELEVDYGNFNLSDMIRAHVQSLHVHDALAKTAVPTAGCNHLRWCRVERCPNLETVFPLGARERAILEIVWASDLLAARCIWSKGRPGSSWSPFASLRHLHLRSCPCLRFAFPLWSPSFPSLETLHIIYCGELKHVFGQDAQGYVTSVAFPRLTTIRLHDLPGLQQICEAPEMVAPLLETIKIKGCWNLRQLPALKGRDPSKKKPAVEMEKDVWDALEWDGMDAGHHPFLYQAPVHSRYYKQRRLLRGTVLR